MPLDWRTPPPHIHYLDRIKVRVELANRDGEAGLAGHMAFLSYFCREYRDLSVPEVFLPTAIAGFEEAIASSQHQVVSDELIRCLAVLKKK